MGTKAYQWLFLACFPVALGLALLQAWPAALIVFFVGVPFFWNRRNRAAMREMAGMANRPRATPAGREYLPDHHPAVIGLGRLGERFTKEIPVLDWLAYTGTLNDPNRAAAVASVQRDFFVTTERLLILRESEVMAMLQGAPFEPESFWLRDVTDVRTMHAPGSPSAWELAVEVTIRQDGEDRVAGVWSSQADKVRILAERIERFARAAQAVPMPPAPAVPATEAPPEPTGDAAEFDAAWREQIDNPDSRMPATLLARKRARLYDDWRADRERTGESAVSFLATITEALRMGYRRDLLNDGE